MKEIVPQKNSYNSFEKVLFTEASGTVSQNILSEETLKSQVFLCFETHITWDKKIIWIIQEENLE